MKFIQVTSLSGSKILIPISKIEYIVDSMIFRSATNDNLYDVEVKESPEEIQAKIELATNSTASLIALLLQLKDMFSNNGGDIFSSSKFGN